ncbi:hypothetical protein AN958_12645 [Leucoagaricus sp. SymC.cos]|nr:hypothetical protein AN958_12645 [Leucoagaricus sp. SymC.cos]
MESDDKRGHPLKACGSAGEQSSPLTHVPFDVLLEILKNTGHPGDLLAVARTCKDLCQKLTDPSAFPLWKKMREKIGLPNPVGKKYRAEVEDAHTNDGPAMEITGVQNFVHNEPAYAAFVFDGGVCEVRGKETKRSYHSFALRIRLCGEVSHVFEAMCLLQNACFKEIQTKQFGLLTWSFMDSVTQPVASTIPVLESNNIFSHFAPRILCIVFVFLCDKAMADYQTGPNAPEEGRGTRVSLVDDIGVVSPLPRELNFAKAKNEIWMKFCVDLCQWIKMWKKELYNIHSSNENLGKAFAENEGWNYSIMVNNTSYGPFLDGKYKRREKITDQELEGMRQTIAHELYTFQQRKEARNLIRLRESNIADLWKYYQKLLSKPKVYPFLPPFSTFLELPAVKLLRSTDLAQAKLDVKNAVAENSPVKNMVKQQISTWVKQAKRDFLEKMGGSDEWNNMAEANRMPHPVLRLDAWWKCQVCDGVEPRYESDECLDFAGACRHQCQEEDRRKKRKGTATRPWSANNFVRDDQASAVMRKCLELLNLKPENGAVAQIRVEFESTSWRCMSCSPPLFLRPQSVIGHSHRHTDPMAVEIVQREIELGMRQRPNRFGLARWLVLGSREAKAEVVKPNFGCQHCANVREKEEAASVEKTAQAAEVSQPARVGVETDSRPDLPAEADTSKDASDSGNALVKRKKEFANKFNFNGLRSHLSSKHKIHKVRDEDFWCYKRIVAFPGEDKFSYIFDDFHHIFGE